MVQVRDKKTGHHVFACQNSDLVVELDGHLMLFIIFSFATTMYSYE